MKIPRRLKEIVSRHGSFLSVECEKRGFALVKKDGERMVVDIGRIVTLDQWKDLSSRVRQFVSDKRLI